MRLRRKKGREFLAGIVFRCLCGPERRSRTVSRPLMFDHVVFDHVAGLMRSTYEEYDDRVAAQSAESSWTMFGVPCFILIGA